jgi:photosynthetic reaction center cytochrome c subunit
MKRALPILVLAAALLAGCERPPVETVQHGYRGLGMVQVYNPRTLAAQAPLNAAPAPTDAAPAEGPRAKDVFKNVQVLGDLSVGEFTRTMAAITEWVAPQQGCAYCHGNNEDLSLDSHYTKVVARRMLQMTRHVNADWKSHVAETGVTCFTCHRGQNVPPNSWFSAPPQRQAALMTGNDAGQNVPAKSVGLSSLPYDPLTPFLLGQQAIPVIGPTALPSGNRQSTKQAEWTYGLMMHMSDSLGVNCTFCHNSRSFKAWDQSTPQRQTAWYGIRMARELNNDYLVPLTKTFPAHRLGPTGDVAKVACGTCHQGAYKPLYGAALAQHYPALLGRPAGQAQSAAGDGGAVLFFAVGSALIADDARRVLVQVVAMLAKDASTKATVSGYHSAAGATAANEDLAKQRAFAVRDALVEAGVAPERVVLEKPQSTEANIAGEDPKARRVEVAVK